MIRGRKDLFFLSVLGQLPREYLFFYIRIRSNFCYLEGNPLIHHFSIKIVSLYLFLYLPREKLDRIRVWKTGSLLIISFSQIST
jgi:hypothetical protein